MKKTLENMEIKLLTTKKKLKSALQTIEYAIQDLNKLNASEEAKLEN